MITLRPYQEELIQGLRQAFMEGKKRLVLCAPTGAGKTITFTYMVQQAINRGKKCLIITDRINLLTQAEGTFDKFGIKPELIIAGSDPKLDKQCHVAMIETLFRRAEKYREFLLSRDLVVIDEAHKTAFNKLFPYLSDKCFVIGATATPIRTGNQPSLTETYEGIIQAVDTPDLIKMGNLSKCYSYGVKIDLSGIKKTAGEYDANAVGKYYQENKIFEGVIENYMRITPNTKTIVFASSIDSAKSLAVEMNIEGIPAAVIHSNQSDEINQQYINAFIDSPPGEAIALVNVGILTAGFDCPNIETVILYRATTSLSLFLQMVGRGSRVTDKKNSFFLLDFGNNIQTHDFWEARRTWSLEKEDKRKRKTLGVAPIKECPKCGSFNSASATICEGVLPNLEPCLYEFKKTEEEKQLAYLEELKSMTKGKAMELANVSDLKKKAALARLKLISPYWVIHNLKTVEEAKHFINLMGYNPGWWYVNKHRFKNLR